MEHESAIYPLRERIIPAAYLLLVKEETILMLRRYHTGYEDGNYSLIAGHINAGETPTEAVVREAQEEAGIIISPQKLALAHVIYRRQPEDPRVDFYFTATQWHGEPHNEELDKCDDLRWFPLDDLPANTISHVRTVIDAYRQGIVFSESD